MDETYECYRKTKTILNLIDMRLDDENRKMTIPELLALGQITATLSTIPPERF